MGVVDSLSLIGPPGLKVVYISLTREDQVDFILRKLPKLEMLNGLAVDREELYSSGEESREDEDDSGERQEKADQENTTEFQNALKEGNRQEEEFEEKRKEGEHRSKEEHIVTKEQENDQSQENQQQEAIQVFHQDSNADQEEE